MQRRGAMGKRKVGRQRNGITITCLVKRQQSAFISLSSASLLVPVGAP